MKNEQSAVKALAMKGKVAQQTLDYAVAVIAVGLAVILRRVSDPWIGTNLPFTTLYAAVALSAWYGGYRPAMLAAALGYLATNYFFMEPRGTFAIANIGDHIALGFYLLTCTVIIAAIETMRRSQRRTLEGREQFRVTLSSIGDGVIVTDGGGLVRSLNGEAERLTGWRSAEAAGRPLQEIFKIENEETHEAIENPVDKALRLGSVVGLANHTVLISRAGARTPIDDSAAPIKDDGGPVLGVVLVFRDVTKERAAHEANARLAAIVEYSGDAVFTKDLNGVIQTWNRGAEKLFGYRADEIIGKPITILVPSDRQSEETEILSRLRHGQPSERIETVRVTKDGRLLQVEISVSPLKDSDGRVTGASKIIHDVTDVVAAREALRKERELLSITLSSIGDAVMTTDAGGRITFLNPVAESLTGWRLGEAMGEALQNVFRIVNEETRKPVDNPALRAIREGTIVGLANHTVLIRKDESERPIDDSAAPIHDGQGRVIGSVLVFRDITERKQAEEQLRWAAAFNDAVMGNMGEGLYAVDSQGLVTYMNPAAEALFGWTFEELKGRKMHDMTHHSHPDGSPLLIEECAGFQVRTQGKVFKDYDDWFIRKDGSFFPVTCSSSPLPMGENLVGMVAVFRDVTERKRAEETVQRQAAILQAVNDNTSELIFMKDRAGRLTYANAATLRTIGMTAEEARGSVDKENFRKPAEHQAIRANDERVAETGRLLTVEERYTCADGRERVFLSSKSPLRDEYNEVVGIIGVSLDITQRRELEREREERAADLALALAKRTEEARRAEKAERQLRDEDRRKNEFLAMLAHELRGPLAPLRNLLEVMKRSDGDGYQREQARDAMERQLSQIVRLVDDLIDISRITRGKIDLRKTHLELASVIQQSVEISRPLAECAKHEMVVTLPREPIYLDADPVRLAQVFSNLLNNACKYTPPGGRITLTVERQGSDVVVKIKDNGMGIPPDKLESVFEMFMQIDQSLERSQGGLGIGLTLVMRLVELHEGSIEAYSEELGKGSEFVVRLPILVGKPEIEKAKTASELIEIAGRRILVVDDNVDSAVSLARLLDMTGNETATAHDGLQAVDAAEKFRPEAILLDIGLPKLNGYDACRRIREMDWGKNALIIALTGWGQEDDRSKSKQAGFDAHIVKPVDYVQLMKLFGELRPTPSDSQTKTAKRFV